MICLAKAPLCRRARLAALIFGALLLLFALLPARAFADASGTPADEEKAASQIYAIYASGGQSGGQPPQNNNNNDNNSNNDTEPGVYEPIPGHLDPEEEPEQTEQPVQNQTNQNENNQLEPGQNEQQPEQVDQTEQPDNQTPNPSPGLSGDFPALPDSLQVMLWDAESQNNRRTSVVPVNLALRGAYLPSDVPAMAVSGRTLVPVRLISEQLQANVAWEKATNTVTISQGSKTIVLTIGSSTALVNERPVQVPDNVSVSLVTYEGVARTMVPVRFVVENLSAAVNYDQGQRVVNIVPPQVLPADDDEQQTEPQLPEIIPPPGLDENGNMLRRVVVDAGHGGTDPGTNGSGREEKSVTLEVALKLQTALENLGYEVIMARTTDEYVSLLDRAALTVQADAPVFVSVHCNSAANIPTANGIETYAAPGDTEDAALAACIQKELISNTGAKDRGVKTSSLVVLTHNTAPACLVEIGFMSNKEECAKITAQVYQQKLAEAIATGVDAYFAARAEAVQEP